MQDDAKRDLKKKKECSFPWMGREFLTEKKHNNAPGHHDAPTTSSERLWLIPSVLINIPLAAVHLNAFFGIFS